MTVKEFDKLNGAGCMYAIVEANVIGWKTTMKVVTTADRNVINERFGDRDVVGFEIKTTRTMYLYIK